MARAVEARGGLPLERAYELADRWIAEEVIQMEAEEWAEGTVISTALERERKKEEEKVVSIDIACMP